MVYDDAEKLYVEVRKDGETLLEEAFKAIFPPSVSLSDPSFKSKKTGTIVGFNTTFFPRRDIVEVPLSGAAQRLKSQVVQTAKNGASGFALLDCSAGGGVAYGTGMYANCKPVSGTSSVLSRTGRDSDRCCSRSCRHGPLRAEECECAADDHRGQDHEPL